MEWFNWFKALTAVYLFLITAGVIITIIASEIYCSKMSFLASLKSSALWSVYPTIVYAVATYFTSLRNPFVNVFKSWILSKDESDLAKVNSLTERSTILGVGYLIMLSMWIITMIMINRVNKEACQLDLKEASKFKKNLLAELKAKQEKEEAEKEKAEQSK